MKWVAAVVAVLLLLLIVVMFFLPSRAMQGASVQSLTSGDDWKEAERRNLARSPLSPVLPPPGWDGASPPVGPPPQFARPPAPPPAPAAAPEARSNPSAVAAPGNAPGTAPAQPPAPFPTDREGIRAAIQSKVPEIKECYESWLQANPNLAGKMTISFVIRATDGGDGEVQDVGASSSDISHLPFEGCLKNVMAGMRFEAPYDDSGNLGEMKVRYPFVFASGDGG